MTQRNSAGRIDAVERMRHVRALGGARNILAAA
jgi:hypothetical protein